MFDQDVFPESSGQPLRVFTLYEASETPEGTDKICSGILLALVIIGKRVKDTFAKVQWLWWCATVVSDKRSWR